MYCVIQEIKTKKEDKNGKYKELRSDYIQCTYNGEDHSYYAHSYGGECFKRPVRKAYRISIHESYRENGKVKKRQFVICTARYYELAEGWFCLYDWGGRRIEAAAKSLQVDEGIIYDLIDQKLNPIQDRIEAEFQQTEEFKVHQEHEEIQTLYAAKKAKFNEKYGVSGNEYDSCYDVFGNLKNKEKLEKIKADYKTHKEYEKQSRKNSRGYYEDFYSNYGNSGSSYSGKISSTYNSDEQGMLKQFYRTLSKAYHPDSNPDKDTSEEMKLLNKLKQGWGL